MTAALTILLLLVAFVFLLWFGQERILFQPPKTWESAEIAGQVEYKTSDGQRLVGYLVGNPAAASGILICFHGNADLALWQLDWAKAVLDHTGQAVFLAEYRGYMGLGGSPSYATTKLDAKAAYDYIRSKFDVRAEDISLFGHSLGSAVATELAQLSPPRALLLQSPFISARAMARLMISPPVEIIWNTVSRIHFDTRKGVSTLATPVSVAHGKRDRIVPFRMGLQVYESARVKGELLIVEKAGHNDLVEAGGEDYWKWMTAALRTPAHPVR